MARPWQFYRRERRVPTFAESFQSGLGAGLAQLPFSVATAYLQGLASEGGALWEAGRSGEEVTRRARAQEAETAAREAYGGYMGALGEQARAGTERERAMLPFDVEQKRFATEAARFEPRQAALRFRQEKQKYRLVQAEFDHNVRQANWNQARLDEELTEAKRTNDRQTELALLDKHLRWEMYKRTQRAGGAAAGAAAKGDITAMQALNIVSDDLPKQFEGFGDVIAVEADGTIKWQANVTEQQKIQYKARIASARTLLYGLVQYGRGELAASFLGQMAYDMGTTPDKIFALVGQTNPVPSAFVHGEEESAGYPPAGALTTGQKMELGKPRPPKEPQLSPGQLSEQMRKTFEFIIVAKDPEQRKNLMDLYTRQYNAAPAHVRALYPEPADLESARIPAKTGFED